MWIHCKSARVKHRRKVRHYNEVHLDETYPGADGSNTLVPAGTVFTITGIVLDVGGPGSRTYLRGAWNDRPIQVPAQEYTKVDRTGLETGVVHLQPAAGEGS